MEAQNHLEVKVDLVAGVVHPHLAEEAEPQRAYQLASSEESESALAASAGFAPTVLAEIASAASVVAVASAELVGSLAVVPVLEVVAVLVAVER